MRHIKIIRHKQHDFRFFNLTLCPRFIVLLALYLAAPASSAETVEQTLANGIVATADYRAGDLSQPAIVLIHGFLQTPNYRTVSSLADAIADAGYSVLAPTLSLGISHRKKSLPCEAVHTHTMQDDTNEIARWVDWLAAKGYSNIQLVGHSYGSLQALAYASQSPNKAVKKVIATSLIDFENALSQKEIKDQLARASAFVARESTAPHQFQISYCKKYVAPPSAFLSYALWTKPRILNVLSITDINLEIIIGSGDKRMSNDWLDLLKASNAHLSIVDGASHFFDSEHEFDLVDYVLASIE